MKNKILFPIIIACLLIFAGLALAQRDLELIYPILDNIAIRPVKVTTLLPDYINYVFALFVRIAGVVCLGALVYHGFNYLTSVDNPGKRRDALSGIFSAFLGAGLILASFLILNSVNPQLVMPYAEILGAEGVILYSNSTCAKEAGQFFPINANSPNLIGPSGYDFTAMSLEFISGPNVLEIVAYNEINYSGNRRMQTTSDIQTCENLSGIGGARSIKFFWKIPGIYLCNAPLDDRGDCPATAMERLLPFSTGLLSPDFEDRVQGLRNRSAHQDIALGLPADLSEDDLERERTYCNGVMVLIGNEWHCRIETLRYGAVLHEHPSFAGRCHVSEVGILNVNDNPLIGGRVSSVTVFVIDMLANPAFASGGVWLCTEPNPQRPTETENLSGCFGPYKRIFGNFDEPPGEYIGRDWYTGQTLEAVPNAQGCPAGNGISSIIIDGSYLVALFDGQNRTGECEVFTSSDPDFLDNRMGRCCCGVEGWYCQPCASSVQILPIAGLPQASGLLLPPLPGYTPGPEPEPSIECSAYRGNETGCQEAECVWCARGGMCLDPGRVCCEDYDNNLASCPSSYCQVCDIGQLCAPNAVSCPSSCTVLNEETCNRTGDTCEWQSGACVDTSGEPEPPPSIVNNCVVNIGGTQYICSAGNTTCLSRMDPANATDILTCGNWDEDPLTLEWGDQRTCSGGMGQCAQIDACSDMCR